MGFVSVDLKKNTQEGYSLSDHGRESLPDAKVGTNQYSTAMSRDCSWKAERFLTRADGLLKKIIKKKQKITLSCILRSELPVILPRMRLSGHLRVDSDHSLPSWWTGSRVIARSKKRNRPRRVLFRKRRRVEVAFLRPRSSSFGFQIVSAVVVRFAASGIHLTSNCLESPLPHPD